MEKWVEYVVKSIVDHPDDVVISAKEEQPGTLFVHVLVNKEDMGKVIGKGGKVANAIRTVSRALGNRENKRVSIKFGE